MKRQYQELDEKRGPGLTSGDSTRTQIRRQNHDLGKDIGPELRPKVYPRLMEGFSDQDLDDEIGP